MAEGPIPDRHERAQGYTATDIGTWAESCVPLCATHSRSAEAAARTGGWAQTKTHGEGGWGKEDCEAAAAARAWRGAAVMRVGEEQEHGVGLEQSTRANCELAKDE